MPEGWHEDIDELILAAHGVSEDPKMRFWIEGENGGKCKLEVCCWSQTTELTDTAGYLDSKYPEVLYFILIGAFADHGPICTEEDYREMSEEEAEREGVDRDRFRMLHMDPEIQYFPMPHLGK